MAGARRVCPTHVEDELPQAFTGPGHQQFLLLYFPFDLGHWVTQAVEQV